MLKEEQEKEQPFAASLTIAAFPPPDKQSITNYFSTQGGQHHQQRGRERRDAFVNEVELHRCGLRCGACGRSSKKKEKWKWRPTFYHKDSEAINPALPHEHIHELSRRLCPSAAPSAPIKLFAHFLVNTCCHPGRLPPEQRTACKNRVGCAVWLFRICTAHPPIYYITNSLKWTLLQMNFSFVWRTLPFKSLGSLRNDYFSKKSTVFSIKITLN